MNNDKRYILTSLVTAKPMSKLEYRKYIQSNNSKLIGLSSIKYLLSDKESNEDGYLVMMGINSYWIPLKDFESMTLELIDNEKLPSSINIGEEMVDNFIESTDVLEIGRKTTVLKVVLKNGYEIIESSGMVDSSNHDINVGEKACLIKAKKRIWDYLGFMLQTAWKGIR